jgi:hypothetical protein
MVMRILSLFSRALVRNGGQLLSRAFTECLLLNLEMPVLAVAVRGTHSFLSQAWLLSGC